MGRETNIDYADSTWSPWIGCDKCDGYGQLREGCRHCYAEAWARRNARFWGLWGPHARRHFFGSPHWRKPLKWQRECAAAGQRLRVLPSLCDPLEVLPREHPQATELAEERLRFWDLIQRTPSLDWLVLTKRAENLSTGRLPGLMLPNLWLGVSCWDQESADRMIPLLLEAPAALRWVSLEPLLGPVEVAQWLRPIPRAKATGGADSVMWTPCIDWVVVGCESRGARPGRRCESAWAHAIVTQCKAANVPCYVKQMPASDGSGLIKASTLARLGWPVQLPARGGGDGGT